MMRRHIFNRQPSYTHPIGTAGIIGAMIIFAGVFAAVAFFATQTIVRWP